MSDLKHLFVPYKLAIKLKEKGFNKPCFGYYNDFLNKPELKIKPTKRNDEYLDQLCVAPLYQQVVDWFRKKYMIEIYIRGCKKIGNFGGYEYVIGDNAIIISKQNNFTEYYEALDKAIEIALKLI